jgi:ADP-ribose pyrophosphatase YjhB (NUDIX family)
MPPGGHLENNETPDEAVLREIKEEAGLLATFIQFESQIKITSQATETALQTPIQVLREEIPEHDGKPQHVHIDFIYILEADDEQALAGEEEGKWYVKDELEALDMYKATKDLCLKFIK